MSVADFQGSERPDPAVAASARGFARRELEARRARIVHALLASIAGLGLLAYLPSVWLSLRIGAWAIAVVDTLVYAAVIVAFVLPRPRYAAKAGILVGVAYLLGLLLLVDFGPVSAGPLWLATVPVLTAILFGLKETIFSLVLTALALAAGAAVLATGAVSWGGPQVQHPVLYAVVAGNLVVLSTALALGVCVLIGGLRQSAETTEELAAEVADERALLEDANRRLRQEMHDRLEAETRLRQTERVSALGTLAGGIAHNLNNLLTPMLMGVEMLRLEDDPAARDEVLDRMQHAASSARDVVRQVVTFSRALPASRESVDGVRALEEAVRLLRPTLGSGLELVVAIDRRVGWIGLSAADVQQLVESLTANALEAMPQGGTLTIELDLRHAGLPELDADAEFVCLSVGDTGGGMTDETRGRAIEPFFTTKSNASGAGLGLSMVHGIVSAAGGALSISSALGEGTRVRLFLPLLPPPGRRA